MRLIWLMAAMVGLAGIVVHAAPSPWEQPAAALAGQITAILGPGQAHLTIRNLSTISTDEIPAIRGLLEQDLKAHGVTAAGAESANTVKVTLSESARELLWVAEIVEGNQTQVAIVDVGPIEPQQTSTAGGVTLRSQQILTSHQPVLAVLEGSGWLAAAEPESLVLYQRSGGDWNEAKRLKFVEGRGLARDPRGTIVPVSIANGSGFEAFVGAVKCTGSFGVGDPSGEWPATCVESDDPWPIAEAPIAQESVPPPAASGGASAPSLNAFYNTSRNYFTGVVTPSLGVDLPPFYNAALMPRAAGSAALLVGGIDGKVQLVENRALEPVAGTRDWGSDFAALRSGCGAGTQIIASGSGEATNDSLRAYELPALEAILASAPLAMNGTIMALWPAPDGKSVLAVVRNAANEYEVDRVTALCN